MNIASILLRSLERDPQAPALAKGGKVVATFQTLKDRVASLSAGLAARGVGPGERVAIFMANRPEYLELMLATWWVGGAVVPINAKLTAGELDVILEQASPVLSFYCPSTETVFGNRPGMDATSEEFALLRNEQGQVDPVPVSPHDLAWLFFTSGTTGTPKGAMISHGNLFSAIQGYLTDVDDIPPGAAILHFGPLSHGTGVYALPFMAQGGVSVLPETPGFSTSDLITLVQTWPQSCMFAAPTMIGRLVRDIGTSKPDLSNLRTIVYGGGPMYLNDLLEAAETLGPVFAQIYGQGECPMTITAMHRRTLTGALEAGDLDYLASVGRAFLGTGIRITDSDGQEMPLGEVGEILVQSATVAKGYWNNPAATEETFGSGWLKTGDLGRLGARGELTIEGRSKEMIISGGMNVYPIEVEVALMAHPQVEEAAVIGLPHPEWGETVAAFVVSRISHDAEQALDDHCREHIARFKCPKIYHMRDSLPKNAYGKVDKRQLVASLGD